MTSPQELQVLPNEPQSEMMDRWMDRSVDRRTDRWMDGHVSPNIPVGKYL